MCVACTHTSLYYLCIVKITSAIHIGSSVSKNKKSYIYCLNLTQSIRVGRVRLNQLWPLSYCGRWWIFVWFIDSCLVFWIIGRVTFRIAYMIHIPSSKLSTLCHMHVYMYCRQNVTLVEPLSLMCYVRSYVSIQQRASVVLLASCPCRFLEELLHSHMQ